MLVALPHLLSLWKLASSSAAGCLENISSAKLTDCIMFQDLTRTHGNIPFVKCIKIKKIEISQGNLAFLKLCGFMK